MRQRGFTLISVIAAIAGATAVSAQVTTKFKADRQRLEAAAAGTPGHKRLTEGQILGNRLLNPFKEPGVTVQKVLPGSSLSVTVPGSFPAGTAILSERDGVTLSGATLTPPVIPRGWRLHRMRVLDSFGSGRLPRSKSRARPRSRSPTRSTDSTSRVRKATP